MGGARRERGFAATRVFEGWVLRESRTGRIRLAHTSSMRTVMGYAVHRSIEG